MSLTRLLTAPIRMLRKDIITFLIIRRYDLGAIEEKLRYVSVRPGASIWNLREKIWYLLDLPDYCDEIIVLKSEDKEIPLTELRRGNNPHHPYTLEVWLPEITKYTESHKNMLTMGENEHQVDKINSSNDIKKEIEGNVHISISNGTMSKYPTIGTKRSYIYADFMKSDLETKISNISIFKVNKKKSKDSFTNILFKIQSDISTLSNKLSNLENRIQN